MDADTEARRLSPIGLRSSNGYVDLINGPADHTNCMGYSCNRRISMYKMVVQCGLDYDLHITSTLPKNTRFHMPYADDDCRVKISLYMARQNRMDVFRNGEFIPPMNTKSINDDGSLGYFKPDDSFIPSVTSGSGANYMQRSREELHFVMHGGDVMDVNTATSLILNLDVVTEINVDEFYDSNSFPEYLANLLGVDPSYIVVVNVIREDSRRRRRDGSTGITIEIAKPVNADEVSNFGDDAATTTTSTTATTEARTTTTASTTTVQTTTTSVLVSTTIIVPEQSTDEIDTIAAALYNTVITNEFADTIDSMGLTQTGSTTIQKSPAPVPDLVQTAPWYEKYDCTSEQAIDGTCARENSINPESLGLYQDTNSDADAQTSEITLTVPRELRIVEQPSKTQLANEPFHQAIVVAMVDSDGVQMQYVGLPGSPWSVGVTFVSSVAGSNALVGQTSAVFDPVTGLAVFDKVGVVEQDQEIVLEVGMLFPANYSISVALTAGFSTVDFDDGWTDAGTCESNEEGMNPVKEAL